MRSPKEHQTLDFRGRRTPARPELLEPGAVAERRWRQERSEMEHDWNQLIEEATQARENASAPFSKFKVGAALKTADGRIYHGCNVENCTYALTVCAERVALLSAIAAGERKFSAIAVVTQGDTPSAPCGPCRQLMWEYCGDIDVAIANLDGRIETMKLSVLFPRPFEFRLED
jgi:cytidine deaminase